MKRTLAVSGFTMLGTLLVFCNIQSFKAINAAILTAFVALLLSLIFKKTRENKALPWAFTFIIISLVILSINDKGYEEISKKYDNSNINVSGYLISMPYKQNGRYYYIIETDTVNGKKEKLNIRIACSSPIELEATDKITADIRVFLLGKENDAYLNYLKSKNLIFGAYPVGEALIEKQCSFSITQTLLLLRTKMSAHIMHILPNDYGAVITGLVLGDKSNLSYKTENAFRLCGVSHLFAVSGLHISTWSLLIFEAMKRIRFSQRNASLVSSGFCIFFMALTGFNPPVVRAGIMMIMVCISGFFEREADSFNSIGLALTIMLIINPYNAVSVSLLLSVLATLGILIIFPFIYSKASCKIKRIRNKYVKAFLLSAVSIVCVSISVSAFTIPIYIFVFKSISTIQVISNLVMLSLGSFCMELSGIAALLLILGLDAVGKPLLILAGIISKFITGSAYRLSQFRYCIFPLNTELSLLLLILFCVIGLIIYFIKYKNQAVIKALCIGTSVLFICVNLTSFICDFDKLKLAVADIGEGTAVVISYRGNNIIFSCEGEYFAESTICDIMNIYGISTVDYLCLPKGFSHYEKIVDGYNVHNIFTSSTEPFDCVKLKCNIAQINKNEVILDNLIIGVENDFAIINFGNTKILIAFSDECIFKSYSCDILICKNSIPNNIHPEFTVLSCGKSTEAYVNCFCVCENGTILFSINSDNTFKYRRLSNGIY